MGSWEVIVKKFEKNFILIREKDIFVREVLILAV